jgi:RpiR family carbohydrate utilization transcriptional regulator
MPDASIPTLPLREGQDATRLSTPILERISGMHRALRRSERKVADVVLMNPSGAMTSTMAQLAALADVSEPTVMRFCNAVGAESFQSFRLELAQALALGLPPTHSAIATSDTSEMLISKVFDHSITSLDRARRSLDAGRVEDAIEAILGASSVFFIGYGASGIVAQDAQQKFPLFGIPCEAYVDGHQQFIAASMSGRGAVCVAISNTGRTSSVLDAVETALEQGCVVIGIAGQPSPLLELATISLQVITFEDTDVYTPSTSRLAALAVIDVLATGVAMRRTPEHMQRLRTMKRQLSNIRTGAPRKLAAGDSVDD